MASTWKSPTHRERRLRANTFFWWALAFPLVAIVLGHTAISNTLHAQAILADHSITQAVVSADHETPPTENLVRFKYSFEVDGKTYSKNYPVVRSRADDVEIGGTIPVAYANFDPNQSQREALLATSADMESSLASTLTMCTLAAILTALFWLAISIVIRVLPVTVVP